MIGLMGIVAALGGGMVGLDAPSARPSLIPPRDRKAPKTRFDLERIAEAKEKRERRAARKAENIRRSNAGKERRG
jgi:hypothetical protein